MAWPTWALLLLCMASAPPAQSCRVPCARSESLTLALKVLSDRPRVTDLCCGVSDCLPHDPTRRHYTKLQDYVMDRFPADRVVLGSDWPVCEGACPGSHAKYVAAMKGYLVEKRGMAAAKKLLSENAIRVYRL
jgi:predicted TIM-barrel fold metal-dependent hydrolase